MWVARLADGETVTLPDAPFVHVFAARGSVSFGDTTLREGDAARLVDAGPLPLVADGDTEVIVWESDSAVTR
jgi:redox-sensitive bicupin YhaK (pirin superfamily)